MWAWKSSPFYTIIRLSNKMILPFLSILLTFIGKRIVDTLSGTISVENIKNEIIFLILISCLIGILFIVMQKVDEYIQLIHSELLTNEISKKMMEQSLKADMEFFDNAEYYDSFEAAKGNMYSVINVMWNAISCISYLITAIGTFIVFSSLSIIYAVIIILSTIPSSVANKKYTKTIYEISVDQINDNRKLGYLNFILTSKSFAGDIRLFQTGDYIKKKYIDLWNSLFLTRKKTLKQKSLSVTVLNIFPTFVKCFILLSITFRILRGEGTIGDYILYAGILEQLIGSINGLFISINQIYNDKLRIDNVKSFDKYKNHIVNDGTVILEEIKSIEFHSVDFTYPGTDHNVLEKINFTINQGEKVALVGVNGSGKSTIIKLLLRFYDVTGGNILINGLDIRQYEINSIRKAFSICFQNPSIYGFSLRENIIISDLESFHGDDEKVYQSLYDGDAKNIIDMSPKGLDVYLGRNLDNEGIELSGGQYQKVSLSRTFYRDSQVLILDEPSSSLDPEAENEIFMKMKELSTNKTTLFTSHRLSNITIADKIIVIENGKIIEQGTHKQLMANANRYSVLYNYQAEKYVV
jgi:ABC-type multidrug transport system fused ATPase/permease subunit